MIKKSLVAAALVALAGVANASPLFSLGGNPVSFITLSAANVTGGALYTTNALPYAAIPENTTPPINTVGTWIAAGPNNTNNGGGDAVLDLGAGTQFVSFLWGSPDVYNTLTVTTTLADFVYDAAALGIAPVAGSQSQAVYVNFTTMDDEFITGLTFASPNRNAFEVSNVALAPIPEPSTYALMLAGLGAVGFVARRRRSK